MFKQQDMLKLTKFRNGIATRKLLAELERVRQLPKPPVLKLPLRVISPK